MSNVLSNVSWWSPRRTLLLLKSAVISDWQNQKENELLRSVMEKVMVQNVTAMKEMARPGF